MRTFLRHLSFVYLVAVIGVVGSERMFWYWADTPVEHLEGAVFYALASAAFLAMLRRYEVHSWSGLLLAVPVYAYVTEGVITPVLYSGGPLPFFPLWFTGWHGLLSMAVLVGVVRRLAIARRARTLAVVGVAIGVFWGSWSITSLHPSQLGDPELIAGHGPLSPKDPTEFATYAAGYTAVLFGAHLLVGRVWPTSPARLFRRTEKPLAAVVLLGAAAWTVALPWALPMFVALCWLSFLLLRRHRDHRPHGRPTLLEAWGGVLPARSLLPVLTMAPAAAGSYAVWWWSMPGDGVLGGIYYGVIVTQTVAAALLLAWAWRRETTVVQPAAPSAPDPADATATRLASTDLRS